MTNDIPERLRNIIQKVEERLKFENKASLTPEWLIESEQIFSSKIEGFKNAYPFHAIESGSSNRTTNDSSGVLRGGRVELDSVFVCMESGKHMPLLEERMLNGSVLYQILIRRITSIENTHRILQTQTFSSCIVTSCRKISDLFGFSFSYIGTEVLNYRYDPDTGNFIGKIGSAFNAGTLKTIQIR